MIKKPLKPENALTRLADLCARSEMCSHEALEKLYKWGISRTDSEKIIATLENGRFIDDTRFAASYASDKFRFSGWGKRKIAVMLRAKRISPEIIRNALSLIEDNEYFESAIRILKSRCSHQGLPDTREETARLLRFGAQRGFEPEILFKALAIIKRGEDDE